MASSSAPDTFCARQIFHCADIIRDALETVLAYLRDPETTKSPTTRQATAEDRGPLVKHTSPVVGLQRVVAIDAVFADLASSRRLPRLRGTSAMTPTLQADARMSLLGEDLDLVLVSPLREQALSQPRDR